MCRTRLPWLKVSYEHYYFFPLYGLPPILGYKVRTLLLPFMILILFDYVQNCDYETNISTGDLFNIFFSFKILILLDNNAQGQVLYNLPPYAEVWHTLG